MRETQEGFPAQFKSGFACPRTGEAPGCGSRSRGHIIASKTVSRVLYLTVIYLDAPLPVRSSHPGSGRADRGARGSCSHTGVAPNRVYSDGQFPAVGCALTAPFHPYWQTPASASHLPAVYLCCTFPEVAFGGRYPLSLPYGARTFLMKRPFGQTTRLSVFLAGLLYRKEKKLSTFFQEDFKRSYNFIFCCYRQITI